MKKIFTTIILILILLSGSGCSTTQSYDTLELENIFQLSQEPWLNDEIPEGHYRAYFYVDDQLSFELTTDNNNKITKPNDPYKATYKFIGWYLADGRLFDYRVELYQSIKVYARFDNYPLDHINKLTINYMSANVKVVSTFKKTGFSGIGSSTKATGSGVIFATNNNRYYVLTNNHVVFNINRIGKFTIIDYKGNEHQALLKEGSAQSQYDLAVLSFSKANTDLALMQLADANPIVGEQIIAITSPQGQTNAITLGVVERYRAIDLENTDESQSDVKFDVIRHSAPTAPGSSGGMIINYNFKIVGIHYAGPKDTEFKDRKHGYCIPIIKVRQYLIEHVFSNEI